AHPGESYRLAFTPGLLAKVFVGGLPAGPSSAQAVAALAGIGADRGGYVTGQVLKADGRFPADEPDGNLWLPSGRTVFSPDVNATPAAELAEAEAHFFLVRRRQDQFGSNFCVDYDAVDLMIAETRDAVGNRTVVVANDYRVLLPRMIEDPNRNRTEV